MELSLVEVVVPPVMSYDAITTSKTLLVPLGMSYYGIIPGRSSSGATGN